MAVAVSNVAFQNVMLPNTLVQGSCFVCRRSMPGGRLPEQNGSRPSASSICDACKKFHWRCQAKGGPVAEQCTCSPGDSSDVAKCRACRYKLCSDILGAPNNAETAAKKVPPVNKTNKIVKPRKQAGTTVPKPDFSKIPCTVCGYSSNGIHFGVISCEGCKIFFGRATSQKHRTSYTCLQKSPVTTKSEFVDPNTSIKEEAEFVPTVLCEQKSKCRRCRLQRCLDAGMTISNVITGRYTQSVREKIDAALADSKHVVFEKPQMRRPSQMRKSTCSDEDSMDSGLPSAGYVSSSSTSPGSSTLTSPSSASSSTFSASSTSSPPDGLLMNSPGLFSNLPTFIEEIVSASTPTTQPVCQVAAHQTSPPQAAQENVLFKNSNPAPTAAHTASSAVPCAPPQQSHAEFCDWLIEKCVEAAIRLAPIAQIKIVINDSMSVEQVVAVKADAFVTYVKAISEFVTALPGITNIAMQDRMLLYLHGFFPILSAQLSLNFDHTSQMPANLSQMSRTTNAAIAGCMMQTPANENDFMIKSYLCYVGNMMTSTVGNLKEFALFCALLCFSPDNAVLSNSGQIPALRSSYQAALIHLLGPNAAQRFPKYQNLLTIFRRGVDIFYAHMRDIPSRCSSFHLIANALVLEFQHQFLRIKEQAMNESSTPSANLFSNMNVTSNDNML